MVAVTSFEVVGMAEEIMAGPARRCPGPEFREAPVGAVGRESEVAS
jgi:hypothetical protein